MRNNQNKKVLTAKRIQIAVVREQLIQRSNHDHHGESRLTNERSSCPTTATCMRRFPLKGFRWLALQHSLVWFPKSSHIVWFTSALGEPCNGNVTISTKNNFIVWCYNFSFQPIRCVDDSIVRRVMLKTQPSKTSPSNRGKRRTCHGSISS